MTQKETSHQDMDFSEAAREAERINQDYHYFLHLEKHPKAEKKGRLSGYAVSVKDCICVKGMESRAGSRILSGFAPPYDAAVIEKVREEGGAILGKTSQDVFGFGSFNVNISKGDKLPLNPFDKERVTGGSSGGAAGVTQLLSAKHIALSESTGGSIACPASYCGVYGLTPTYGLVSRYGLMDYATSMDKIGVMAKDLEDVALMLDIISGYDKRDSTSAKRAKEDYTKHGRNRFRIGVVSESIGNGVMPKVKSNLFDKLKGHAFSEVSLPLVFRHGVATYYLISLSEASTNLAKYCGMRYGYHEALSGNFNEYFSKIREEAFSKEEKRRIILGTFARMSGYRDAYYLKALKVRTKMIEEYKSIFRNLDIIVTPTMPNIAPRFDEISKLSPLENFMMDIMTVGPNIAGLPHISIPSGMCDGLPTGFMAIADHFQEKKLIDFARGLT
ncbi:MAG: Asp-tRNA(Asn)/Glu-tRNA(Gln) amidotransferase subunit GatA [Nanoarchaeota archaeon]|nr:Asp-tRNA(Asn)/Glu-tRNA(Gln) amidotransferase subunit GatA [Nanoarchaeota archaeon]